ncbi:MAG: UDP-glucose 4-epimerase GalE [Bdellovibrionia bacterium]
MNILITGGAGYIGSHTVQKVLDAGYNPVVFDNLSTGFSEAVPAGVKLIKGDVRDQSHLEAVLREEKISAVIHFAAKLIVPESIEKPLDYYENNTQGVVSLAKACVAIGVKHVVFSSTAAVYGDSETSNLVTEKTATAPLNPYGMSKLMSEQILRDCEIPFGLTSVSLRYFNVAGAALNGKNGQRTKDATHLIKVASEAACGKRPSVGVFGTDYPTPDGTGVRDYIHVEDLADLHVLALEYLFKGGKSDIFNCGYGQGASVKQVLKTVQQVSKVDFKIEEKPRRAGDAAMLVADPTKIKKTFGWQPKHNDLELICRSAFEWERSR